MENKKATLIYNKLFGQNAINGAGKRIYTKTKRDPTLIHNGEIFTFDDCHSTLPKGYTIRQQSNKSIDHFVIEKGRKIQILEFTEIGAKLFVINLFKKYSCVQIYNGNYPNPFKIYIQYCMDNKITNPTLQTFKSCEFILPPKLSMNQHEQLATAFYYYSYGEYKYVKIIHKYKLYGWIVRFKEKYRKTGYYTGEANHTYSKRRNINNPIYKRINKLIQLSGCNKDGSIESKKPFKPRTRRAIKKNKNKLKNPCGRKKIYMW